MSQVGQWRPTNSMPVPTDVRCAPLATKMVRRGERREVPKQGCVAVPPIAITLRKWPHCGEVLNRALAPGV